MGNCYEHGYVIKQDLKEALAFYYLAAGLNDALAIEKVPKIEETLGPESAASSKRRSMELEKLIAADQWSP
jgi:hypothetical protein